MSRRVLPLLLVAAVASYTVGFAAPHETSSRKANLYWSVESFDPGPNVTSQAAPKAPAPAPVSIEAVPPSEKVLHQKPFSKDWRRASRLGEGSYLTRAPPPLT